MVLPVWQRCPTCHKMFLGSDAIGRPCVECSLATFHDNPVEIGSPFPYINVITGEPMNKTEHEPLPVEESMDWVYDHLCWRDPRYTYHIKPDEDDTVLPPRTNCSCDNCYTGKDKLAVALLAKAASASVVEKLHDVAVKERDWERHKLNEAMKFATVPDGVAISMHSNFVLLELSCRDTLSESEQHKAVANIFRWISDLVANCPNRWNAADGNKSVHTVR